MSPKATLQRPVAGTQVPYCPIDKKMSDCWSPLDPSTFKVRGHNYMKYKFNISLIFNLRICIGLTRLTHYSFCFPGIKRKNLLQIRLLTTLLEWMSSYLLVRLIILHAFLNFLRLNHLKKFLLCLS